MERVAVQSKLLKSVGYDSANKVLEVEFLRNGRVYQYTGVEPEQAATMLAAKSIGSYFLNEIKPAFPAKRMDGRDSDATRKEGQEDDPTRPKEGWPDPEDVA